MACIEESNATSSPNSIVSPDFSSCMKLCNLAVSRLDKVSLEAYLNICSADIKLGHTIDVQQRIQAINQLLLQVKVMTRPDHH